MVSHGAAAGLLQVPKMTASVNCHAIELSHQRRATVDTSGQVALDYVLVHEMVGVSAMSLRLGAALDQTELSSAIDAVSADAAQGFANNGADAARPFAVLPSLLASAAGGLVGASVTEIDVESGVRDIRLGVAPSNATLFAAIALQGTDTLSATQAFLKDLQDVMEQYGATKVQAVEAASAATAARKSSSRTPRPRITAAPPTLPVGPKKTVAMDGIRLPGQLKKAPPAAAPGATPTPASASASRPESSARKPAPAPASVSGEGSRGGAGDGPITRTDKPVAIKLVCTVPSVAIRMCRLDEAGPNASTPSEPHVLPPLGWRTGYVLQPFVVSTPDGEEKGSEGEAAERGDESATTPAGMHSWPLEVVMAVCVEGLSGMFWAGGARPCDDGGEPSPTELTVIRLSDQVRSGGHTTAPVAGIVSLPRLSITCLSDEGVDDNGHTVSVPCDLLGSSSDRGDSDDESPYIQFAVSSGVHQRSSHIATAVHVRDTDFCVVPGLVLQLGKLAAEGLGAATHTAELSHANPVDVDGVVVRHEGHAIHAAAGAAASSAAAVRTAATAAVPQDVRLILQSTLEMPRLQFTLAPTVRGSVSIACCLPWLVLTSDVVCVLCGIAMRYCCGVSLAA